MNWNHEDIPIPAAGAVQQPIIHNDIKLSIPYFNCNNDISANSSSNHLIESD